MSKPSIILLIASSLDGRIAYPSGGETHLGSIEDKRLLSESLSNVDATLFGSGTLKSHKSTFLIKNYSTTGEIQISNKQPISLIAGDFKKFSYEWPYFKQPIKRWLITGKNGQLIDKGNFEKQIFFDNCWKKTFSKLQKEGISSIALLGGSKLIYSIALENLIDEIKITIVPRIIGGKYTWIPSIETNKIFNFKIDWNIKSIKQLSTDEILIHYTKNQ